MDIREVMELEVDIQVLAEVDTLVNNQVVIQEHNQEDTHSHAQEVVTLELLQLQDIQDNSIQVLEYLQASAQRFKDGFKQ